MKNRDNLENSNDWATPPDFYEKLNNEFHFDFDPCPLHSEFDGLKIEWGKCNYVNPPYDRVNKPLFIQKAYEEWKKGKTVVMLLPAATGTKQFHEIILPNASIIFIKGRISFHGYNTKGEYSTKNKGKHDSMLVIFKHN
jgi:DNA N-6-adenine-methyltransferase (Dam)